MRREGGSPGPHLRPHGALPSSGFTRDKTLVPQPSLFMGRGWLPSPCPTPRVQHTPQHRHFLQEMETLGFVVKVHPWEEGADRGQWLLLGFEKPRSETLTCGPRPD